jgi:hypothetical protein
MCLLVISIFSVAKVRILSETNSNLLGKLHKNFLIVTECKVLCKKYNKMSGRTLF